MRNIFAIWAQHVSVLYFLCNLLKLESMCSWCICFHVSRVCKPVVSARPHSYLVPVRPLPRIEHPYEVQSVGTPKSAGKRQQKGKAFIFGMTVIHVSVSSRRAACELRDGSHIILRLHISRAPGANGHGPECDRGKGGGAGTQTHTSFVTPSNEGEGRRKKAARETTAGDERAQ